MEKSFLLARANIRRAKGQTASILVLILLAALTLNLWLMLAMDYRQNFERYHERLHGEHVMLAVDGNDRGTKEFLLQTLEADKRTDEYCLDASLHMVGSLPYNNGEINSEFIFLKKQAAVSRQIGRVEITQDSNLTSGIYLPLLYKSDENAVGKTVTLTIGNQKMSYIVCGFFNSIMAGSHNCSMCEFLLTEDKYEELKETAYAPEAFLCSVRLKEKSESADFEASLKNAISSRYPEARTVSNSYSLVAQSRYISQMICSGILSAMAFFILLIALVVIASNIIHYIQENMKNLGALKAVGYTGGQLAAALLVQFAGLVLAASLIGASLSYALFPSINVMMISQTGIPYQMHFLPLPFLLTLIILTGAAAVTVFLSSRRLQKIEPITALRQGVLTHSFKKNHVPLDRTKAPLHMALALKTTFSGMKHNITICITMLALSLVAVFSGVMTENMIADTASFLNLIVGETADSCISIRAEAEDKFVHEMNADSRVSKIYLFHSTEVRHEDGVALMATLCDDFEAVNNQKLVFEGRFPRYDNEIAIAAKYAKEQGLEIGDEITIEAEGKKAAYLISGFTQISNNLGKDCLLTRAGYERLGELLHLNYYLNLSDKTDIDAFHKNIEEKLGDEINTTINISKVINASSSVYVSLMTMIVIAVFILSAIIIIFVLYLMVRTILDSKKQEYGIYKALGFTTRQLILQTALSFMPAVVISSIIGITASCLIINPLTALFLSSIGIVKCTFTVPYGFVTAAGGAIVLFTFGTACLMSLKIKKIAPRTLLAGE